MLEMKNKARHSFKVPKSHELSIRGFEIQTTKEWN